MSIEGPPNHAAEADDGWQLDGLHLKDEESEMAPSYKITYFNIFGLVEPMRMILKYANIEFEDERIEKEQWPELKPKMPFGQLPVLTVNGKQYTESIAITRFLAKKAKLVGKDEFENLEIDSVVDVILDLRLKIGQYSRVADGPAKEAMKAVLFNETIPYYLERLDKIAKDNNGHLACNKLTWADLYLAGIMSYVKYGDMLEKYSNLQAVAKNVQSIPQIKKWIEERPKTIL